MDLPPLSNILNLLEKPGGVSAQQSADLEEFNDIQAPIAIFDLGNEGLGAIELVGQLLLGQTRCLAGLGQGDKKGAIGAFID